jgi:hypothetical protein
MEQVRNEELDVLITMKRNSKEDNSKEDNSKKENKLNEQDAYLLEIRRKKYGVRKDLLTGEEFIPKKSNQKFANNSNRLIYYNNIHNDKVKSFMQEKSSMEQYNLWGDIVDSIKWNEQNLNRDGLVNSLKDKYKIFLKNE